jgi:hypothetical protein
MQMESKQEGTGGGGDFSLATAASSPSGEERKEISAGAAEPGQLHTSDRHEDTTRHRSLSCPCVRLCPVHVCI